MSLKAGILEKRERVRRYRLKVQGRIGELKWSVLALYLARRDPRVPLKAKLAIVLAVGYFVSPIDLIPDFIPVIGQLDELVIVGALTAFALGTIPAEVMDEYRAMAKVQFAKGAPKSYLMGIIIVSVYVLGAIGLVLLVAALWP